MTNTSVLCPVLSTKTATVECLKKHDIWLKKKFGQNFLVDTNVINRIISLSGVSRSDNVVEVGPGIGSLTCALLNSDAQVTSIETDDTLIDALLENVHAKACNFTLIQGDAVKVRQEDLQVQPNKFISNLPYSVAARLIIDFFQKLPSLAEACVMVQKEVADRICAEPGNKDYGAYTVKLQSIADVAGRFEVSRNSFYPPPRVDSTVLKLVKKTSLPANIDDIFKIANALFCNRRKTIYNCAVQSFGKQNVQNIENWFLECNISPKLRAEVLKSEDFQNLASKFKEFVR